MDAPYSKMLKWRVEAWAHSVVATIVGRLPSDSVFRFGEALGRLVWPLMKERRATIIRNLRIAGGTPASEGDMQAVARACFIRAVANLVSSSVSTGLPAEDLGEVLEMENPEMLEAALAQGNGVVVLLAHMGNWELLTRLHRFFPKGTRSGAFYRPLNNPILNERVLQQREADGTRLFSKRDSLHLVSGFLRENGVVGILADQRVGLQGEVVPFFGRITRASPLPGLLARRCKSEVLSLSLETVEPGKWRARYHPVAKPYDTKSCMAALEAAMRVSITDVFWLQERWRVYAAPGTPLAVWFKKPDVRGKKPHRVLIWKTEEEASMQLAEEWVHGDMEYETAIDQASSELESIDLSKALPIDMVLTFSENQRLSAEAKRLGIPVIRTGVL